ncbi:MAG: NUDIX domain-containing protein [Clostridiaceae bacterium]|nr:NUDIX domain-containing protein [Clostridiaceae bacterium]
MIKEVKFYETGAINDNKLAYAVIAAKYRGQWLYVRHRERETWEIPGGHREENETIYDTASRELVEETGAVKFSLTPVCIYSVVREDAERSETFGQLFYSEVETLDSQLLFETAEVKLFDDIPDNLTYPMIQPFLHRKVEEFLESCN